MVICLVNAQTLIPEPVSNVGNRVISQNHAQTMQVDKFNKDSSNLDFKTKFSNSNSLHFSPLMETLVPPVERAASNVANKVTFQENVQIKDKEAVLEQTELALVEVEEVVKVAAVVVVQETKLSIKTPAEGYLHHLIGVK